MKKTKSMRLAVLAAGLLCCSIFTVPAYAQSSEPQEETPPAQTEAQPETQNPFSTDGTGTCSRWQKKAKMKRRNQPPSRNRSPNPRRSRRKPQSPNRNPRQKPRTAISLPSSLWGLWC